MKTTMKTNIIASLPLALLAYFPTGLNAQVSIQAGQMSYQQNFDRLGTARNETAGGTGGDLKEWKNNKILHGWYAQLSNGQSHYIIGNGSVRTGLVPSIRNYGSYSTDTKHAGPPEDRALGLIAGTIAHKQSGALCLVFRNMSEKPISRLDMSFNVEQWRRNTLASSLEFSSRKAKTIPNEFLDDEGWQHDAGLSYGKAEAGQLSGLDGNSKPYQTAISGAHVLEAPLTPGEYLILRWKIPPTNSGSGLAIDDLAISFQ
jgi:hypothetical protein